MCQHKHFKLGRIFWHFSQLQHSCLLNLSYCLYASTSRFLSMSLERVRLAHTGSTGCLGFNVSFCNILQRNFLNYGVEILALSSVKNFGLCFSCCSHMAYTCSKFGENVPKTDIYLFFYFQVAYNCSN